MTQLFIVDDHALLRETLRSFIESEPDMSVCGDAPSAGSALEQIPGARPDLALIDLSMPDMSGIDLVRALQKQFPELPLVVLSGHSERSYVNQAFEAGARGYILKGNAEELIDAIRCVMKGDRYVSEALTD